MADKQLALIADDIEMNRDMLKDILEDHFDLIEAEDGEQVLELIEKYGDRITVLLLDLVMPRMNGFDVLAKLHEEREIDRFPILIISGESDLQTEEKCLECGVTDFIHKPFAPSLVMHRVRNAVTLYAARNNLRQKVWEKTEELRQRNIQLSRTNEDTIELLGNVVEARSLESGAHVRRVKGFTRILSEKIRSAHPELNITAADVDGWAMASAMHDLGKVMVPDEILLKPGRLTPEEFEIMKLHTVNGCTVLENSRHMWDESYYRLCWQICRYHHEKWDGSGYPDGIAGDEIPLVAQVVSVADCYDALTTERVYKRAFTPEEAYQMIMEGQCGVFSPLMLETLSQSKEEFRELTLRITSVQPPRK